VDKVDANGKPYRVEVLLNAGPEDLAVGCSAGASSTHINHCVQNPSFSCAAPSRTLG
jgi:hypothetical protein